MVDCRCNVCVSVLIILHSLFLKSYLLCLCLMYTAESEDDLGKPQLQLGFMCFLVDQKTNEHFVVSKDSMECMCAFDTSVVHTPEHTHMHT